ncbi:MAG: glycosyltransferase [Alphaproteobacteria bacterium]|nr:glycosyltransferase [Alphaproteobacteria bacterium]
MTNVQNAPTLPTPSQVTISAVICSCDFERRACLRNAIASLRAQSVTPFEIIAVIDHNDQLFRSVKNGFPDIRVVENVCSKGLSGARNTGVQMSGGSVVAFLDDDATGPDNWIAALSEAYRDPAVMAAGGSAIPSWPDGSPPAWFPPEFNWIVGCTYRGMPTKATATRNLFGCNMSFRRDVFRQIGGFHDAMGRLSDMPLRSCEETEFCIRLTDHDPHWAVLYLPDLPVQHVVAPHRCKFGYFVSRCYNEGLSKAVVTRLSGVDRSLADERSYVVRVLPRAVLEGFKDGVLRGRISGFLRALAIITGLGVTTIGYAYSLWTLRRRRDLTLQARAHLEPVRTQGAGK